MAWVSPRAWATSETLTAAKMNEISSALNAVGDKPASYTPTVPNGWSTNFTVSGTNQEFGYWTRFTITVNFTGVPGGSGIVNLRLPSAPSADYVSFASSFGTCITTDSSASNRTSGVAVFSGGQNLTAYFGAPTGTRLGNAYPYTFGSGDTCFVEGTYYRD